MHAGAGSQQHFAGRRVDFGGSIVKDACDALRRVERFGTERGVLDGLLVEQESFRKRRALVGEMRLIADQGDRFLVTAGAKRGGGLKTRLPGADDHGSHYCCVSGVCTTRPSSSFVTGIWQPRRLLARRGHAVVSSISFSSS